MGLKHNVNNKISAECQSHPVIKSSNRRCKIGLPQFDSFTYLAPTYKNYTIQLLYKTYHELNLRHYYRLTDTN